MKTPSENPQVCIGHRWPHSTEQLHACQALRAAHIMMQEELVEPPPPLTRDALEAQLLREELANLEKRAYCVNLISLTTSEFSMQQGRRLGVSLNDMNVIMYMDPMGIAAEEGTMRVGDRIIAINNTSSDGIAIKDLLKGVDRVVFVLARKVYTEPPKQREEAPPSVGGVATAAAAPAASAETAGGPPALIDLSDSSPHVTPQNLADRATPTPPPPPPPPPPALGGGEPSLVPDAGSMRGDEVMTFKDLQDAADKAKRRVSNQINRFMSGKGALRGSPNDPGGGGAAAGGGVSGGAPSASGGVSGASMGGESVGAVLGKKLGGIRLNSMPPKLQHIHAAYVTRRQRLIALRPREIHNNGIFLVWSS